MDLATLSKLYGIPLAVLAVFCAAAFVAARWLGPAVAKIAERFGHPCLAEAARVFLKPSAYCLIALGAYGAVEVLSQDVHTRFPWLDATGKVCAIACIVFLTVGLVRAAHVIPEVILGVGSKLGTGKALANFLTSILQAFILLIAATMILAQLGQNINGVLAGLGLGSLSFALAGQDIVSNIFGGIVIITEKPFEIGDWVKTVDVEGTVEDISLRSTKIRTLDNCVTVVPNQKFTSAAITNWTRLNRRLAQFTLGLEYGTSSAVLKRVLEDLRAMLTQHPDIHADTVQVRFSGFDSSTLNIFVQFYTSKVDLAQHRAVMEDVNLKILDLMAQNGASFAFPSRTIYMADPAPAGKD